MTRPPSKPLVPPTTAAAAPPRVSVAGVPLGRGLGRIYFAIQALAGALWWILVPMVPAVRTATLGDLPAGWIAAGDLPFFVLASALTACGWRWAVWIAWPWTLLMTGLMVVYSTLSGAAGWGTILMLASAAASTFATALVLLDRIPSEWTLRGPFGARVARPAGTAAHLAVTGAQLVFFWGFFLVVIPALITWCENRWGVALPWPDALRWLGAVVLAAASALGVWSAIVMAAIGRGTPLPGATARELVIAGPYRWVRNPMAVAGIAQGVAVGLLLGSWMVVVYALCGSLVWNWAVRPHEEAELRERFGAPFERYEAAVRCWVPRSWRPYAAG